MRRFDFDDEDPDREEVERFLNSDSQEYLITPEEYKGILEEEMVLYEAKFRETSQKLKYKLLLHAIDLSKGSFLWKFYSLNTRLNHIEKIYKKLNLLLELEQEEK
jgi:hypothetical protein